MKVLAFLKKKLFNIFIFAYITDDIFKFHSNLNQHYAEKFCFYFHKGMTVKV